MTKWSSFIRNLGTAGPATVQGIYDLGFALRSEIPALFAKYLRVDATQTFTTPEKLQGRTNLGLGTISTQASNSVAITGGTIAGITDLALADGGTGASSAPAARTNLGLGTIATQDANAVAITGGTIAGITDLALADGGTGASTAAGARTNLGLGTIATQDASAVALTGAPTAPTAAPGTNTTQLATTGFVTAAVAAAKTSITLGTPIATTTGVARDFVVPAGAKRVSVLLNGVSTNGTSPVVVQLGTGGVPQTTSYAGSVSSGTTVTSNSSSLVIHPNITAATLASGKCVLDLLTANTWVSLSNIGSNGNTVSVGAGAVSLTGALDIVRITTVNGTDTFDAGVANVTWEF